jgi:hypothetical protein
MDTYVEIDKVLTGIYNNIGSMDEEDAYAIKKSVLYPRIVVIGSMDETVQGVTSML